MVIAAQRWWIDREIIDRYWVPYVVVAVVVVARAVADLGALRAPRTRHIALLVAGSLVLMNVVQVASFGLTRFDRGVELNEVRYQDAEIFDVLADAGVEQVLTDSVRLLELHLVVLGDVDVAVRDVGCRWSGESRAVEMATSAVGPTAVVLVAACDRPDTRAELAEIPDSQLIEGDIGTVVLLGAG